MISLSIIFLLIALLFFFAIGTGLIDQKFLVWGLFCLTLAFLLMGAAQLPMFSKLAV